MTTVLLFLILALGVGVAVALWRLLRPASQSAPAEADLLLASTGSVLETYQPMTRLFVEEDFAFLSAHPGSPPALVKRLRRQRSRVLRLYLTQMRADFQRVYGLCRALAARSQDPNFAATLTQQALTFYGLWCVLQVRCSLGWFLHVRVDTVDLVGAFERMTSAARACVEAAMPQQGFAASTA